MQQLLICPPHLHTAAALPWENLFVAFDLAHHGRRTIELLQREILAFISPNLWPPNSRDLNPVDCRIWGVMQDRVYQTIRKWPI